MDNLAGGLAQRAALDAVRQADSWYLGANVPGKPRLFMLFCGGFGV